MSIKKAEYSVYTCDLCSYKENIDHKQQYTNWATVSIEQDATSESRDDYHICFNCKKSYWNWVEERRDLDG